MAMCAAFETRQRLEQNTNGIFVSNFIKVAANAHNGGQHSSSLAKDKINIEDNRAVY